MPNCLIITFLFSPFFSFRYQCFHTILHLYIFPYSPRGGVFVHVWVCVSVCRVIAAHWKPQRGQPQESLTAISGSPLFCPPFLLLLLFFLNLCPILKPHYPHPPDCCFSKIPPILISFRNSPFLHPTKVSVLLLYSISCTFFNPLPQTTLH